MTEGEEVYQDKGDSLIHIVKYALDLFRLSLLAVGSVSLSKRLQKKKRWFAVEEEADQYFQAIFNRQYYPRGLRKRQHSRLLKLLVALEGFA
jgi:hypothetical protein